MDYKDDEFFDYQNFYMWAATEVPDNCNIVEIGCWVGASAKFLIRKLQHLNKKFHMTLIDNFQFGGMSQRNKLHETMDEFGDNVTILEMTSWEAADLIEDGSQDFVFIDGCHAYVDVYQDITNYRQKVKVGGILAGHDYELQDGGCFNVKRAVNELIPCFKVFPTENKLECWYSYKGDNRG